MKTTIKEGLLILFLLIFFSCGQSESDGSDTSENNPSSEESTCKKLNGSIYQLKYENPDIDSIFYTIIFNCKGDTLNGLMFGPDPEGDEGLYFYKENLDSVRYDNYNIKFSLVQQKLYRKPFTLDNYNKNFPNDIAGASSQRLFYTGKLGGDSIVFTCFYSDYNYADTMVFKKKDHLK